MDLGDPTVRSLTDIVAAYNPDQVIWLAILLGLEFVTGVALALKSNAFDWDRVFDIAKKNVWIAAAWGAAFVYSDTAGTIVYGLSLAYVGGGVVQNITSLAGAQLSGTIGQLTTRGPGVD